MTARTKARKRALDVLYEADIRNVDSAEVLRIHKREAQAPFNPYVDDIVAGVAQHGDEIDEQIATFSQGWTLARMPVVDRNLLRIGVWEILYSEVPNPVAISEAVELATTLSTDDSPQFINGLLARIAELAPRLGGRS